MYTSLILFTVVFFSVYHTEQSNFLSKERIHKLNEIATSWKAKQNFHPNTPREHIVKLLGSRKSKSLNTISKRRIKKTDALYVKNNEVPDTFDARKRWPYCKTIGEIRNQGDCGSCWAHSTTGAFADRLCIKTNGKFNKSISVEELTFCCSLCGYGCDGGDPYSAWENFIVHGVVTGGNYNTSDGCQPYKIPPCSFKNENKSSCTLQREYYPECSKTCYGDKTINYKYDHHTSISAYALSNVSMQQDVMTYGPIEVTFSVYDDFVNYESGVYFKTENASFLGLHSVKLIGWGRKYGKPYWLVINSWGSEFGDQGTFKILRGVNECDIEEESTAGIPYF
ncbi:Cysteine peptidase, cysteine active site,Peptidase C1A, papain C-terminal,Peptidase C1A [Cinara cedri]|uniref:Cysteine peptidase, cysteine active site,Peptidase C1A, papain C-terminal,Peptidase C1A n=1 Tax=Cinara cedri TaxID=506608 RepID=A0A5E4LZM4_9HEMI|nr:Cysteine peptidase, cysteine active site,Peptidase C1A, papain C-terminal,Peptidase C1A [Cinara cedri]